MAKQFSCKTSVTCLVRMFAKNDFSNTVVSPLIESCHTSFVQRLLCHQMQIPMLVLLATTLQTVSQFPWDAAPCDNNTNGLFTLLHNSCLRPRDSCLRGSYVPLKARRPLNLESSLPRWAICRACCCITLLHAQGTTTTTARTASTRHGRKTRVGPG